MQNLICSHNSTIKKANNLIKKCTKDLKKHIFKEEMSPQSSHVEALTPGNSEYDLALLTYNLDMGKSATPPVSSLLILPPCLCYFCSIKRWPGEWDLEVRGD